MAHVILGLLLIAPQSLYDLVKSFEAGVSLFYSASSGSIKRALDGLLRDGRIEVAETSSGARGRKAYRVTDDGRAAFREWMTGDLKGDVETAALSRLFFLGLLDPGERTGVLRRVVGRIETDLAQLEALGARFGVDDVPEEYRDVAAYQRATLDYGLASHRTALSQFREILAREKAADDSSAPASSDLTWET
ncbi:PadR family transcriptional regulator [Myceligenerans crystallogenes]|uniref:Transcription regulator PadR N-terminal domain-containing protein n=1 Tax=Myceligenerans crystallogenes TaxID=316335 RepID=A0ABP4ZFJ7_9MICO